MRKYNFEQFKRQIKDTYYSNFRQLEPMRKASRRPRKAEDMEILLKMMLWRKEKWLQTGKLVELGPRRYRLKID